MGLFKITSAAMTPGIHPQRVNKKTMRIEPQPLSMTDSGGNTMANKTLKTLIAFFDGCICAKDKNKDSFLDTNETCFY